MKRTFEITLPSFPWRNFLTLRFLAILIGLGVCFGGFYWWNNVRPFFKIDQAHLCVSSTEVRSEGAGRLLNCSLEEGDFFQRGQHLFSLDNSAIMDQLKEADRKIAIYRQEIDQVKQQIDQSMEQYVYLQDELNLEGKTSELLDQILGEAQKMQGNCFQMEKEIATLLNERSEQEKLAGKRSMTADFEGVVLRRFKQMGDSVFDREPVYLISNPQKRWIEAEIPEEMLLKIPVGSVGFIEFPSFPKRKWDAQVSWISPLAKEGKLKLRLTAENLPSYSGLSAKASIRTRSLYATAD
jgi:multidrug resistance efflux pump